MTIKQIDFGEVNELGKTCVMVGKILNKSVAGEDGLFTADVKFTNEKVIKEVPIVYNCENGLKDHPFKTYMSAAPYKDLILVVNRGGKKNPTASDLTIVGFADGVPRYCKKYLYIKTGTRLFFHPDVNAYRCFIWDIEKECFAKIRNGENGDFINFPCDPEQDDMKAWLKQRDSFGESVWEFFVDCGQSVFPWGEDVTPCEKNGLSDIATDSLKFYPAWATGWYKGHSAPGWCRNSAYCPKISSQTGCYIDKFKTAEKPYVRIEYTESGNGNYSGTVQVFTHLSERVEEEDEGIGSFSYNVTFTKCGPTAFGGGGWQARTSMNIPRFIAPFGSSKVSSTIIAQMLGITITTMDIVETCESHTRTLTYHTEHHFVAQVDSFPEGIKDVDLTTLSRSALLEAATKEAFDSAYNEIVVGHSNEHDVSWWEPSVHVDILGGRD